MNHIEIMEIFNRHNIYNNISNNKINFQYIFKF
jgi:hypothetical protein